MRENLITNGLDTVGYAADGATNLFEDYSGEIDTSTATGQRLDDQLRSAVTALEDQAAASSIAGKSAGDMTGRLDEGHDVLVKQLEAMGSTQDQANDLAESYGALLRWCGSLS